MTAPVAKDRSDPSPGPPPPDHPVRGPAGLFTEVRRPSTCGTPRITNLFFRSANPSRFSRISPNSRISAGFSKFSFKAGLNSATKRGLSFGSVAMKAGSMVKLFSAGWQVPQVRPLPPNVSLKNRSLPFAMSWLKRSGGGEALLQPDSPTRAHTTKAVETSSRDRIRPPFGRTPSTLPVSVAPQPRGPSCFTQPHIEVSRSGPFVSAVGQASVRNCAASSARRTRAQILDDHAVTFSVPHVNEVQPQVEQVERDERRAHRPSESRRPPERRRDEDRAAEQVGSMEAQHQRIDHDGLDEGDHAEIEGEQGHDGADDVAPRQLGMAAPRGRDHARRFFEALAQSA